MRYGLLALSMVLLGGGGFAAQSALAITNGAAHMAAAAPDGLRPAGSEYGPVPFATGDALRLAMR
jgi:hypothetical protein